VTDNCDLFAAALCCNKREYFQVNDYAPPAATTNPFAKLQKERQSGHGP